MVSGEVVDAGPSSVTTPFTHKIPEGPELTSPADEATGLPTTNVVLRWNPVTRDLDGAAVTIVGYQVIVESIEDPEFPQGFARPLLSVYLPPAVTQLTIPDGFLEDDACYEWEVLAIEDSGNQTISAGTFETGEGCEEEEEGEEPEDPQMEDAKILIEHNAEDEDTGFQAFGDGDPWNELQISGPGGQRILTVNARGGLFDFGLTELFFETNEPENDEMPIPDVLALLPEGTYTFRGIMVDGPPSTITATLTHTIPAEPTLITPQDDAEDVDPANTVITWTPVTTDLDGGAINIVGYQVIVEETVEPLNTNGFAAAFFTMYVPANITSVRVPAEFMQGSTEYEIEILAIEESGNQTIAAVEFMTR